MTTPFDIDAMSIEDLVDLNERIQKKINEKIAAEKTEIEKRQHALAKLEDRVAGKKPTKTSTRTKSDPVGKATKEPEKPGNPPPQNVQTAPEEPASTGDGGV